MVVLMEDKGSLYRGMARRYLLQAAPEAADMPASDLLALGELPSVDQACQHGQIVYDSNVRPGTAGYGDWEALAADYGMDGFLTAPLSCAEEAMGALVLAASTPVSLDRYLRRLAGDVAQSLSQTLYTLSCIEQMRAAEQIIHDIMPEKVKNLGVGMLLSKQT
jgi:transcriptional regulator with GAF, ATPase, and Fis domain